ncbi:MAG: hypothetical protein ACR2IN_02995 [Thermoleophilaceae bacterium]
MRSNSILTAGIVGAMALIAAGYGGDDEATTAAEEAGGGEIT